MLVFGTFLHTALLFPWCLVPGLKMFYGLVTTPPPPPPLTQLDVSDDDSKGWMQASKSYDNLTAALRDSKKPEKKGLLSRLRNLRKTYARKSSKDKHKGSDSGADTSGAEIARVNSLTASMSMPDIACEFCRVLCTYNY